MTTSDCQHALSLFSPLLFVVSSSLLFFILIKMAFGNGGSRRYSGKRSSFSKKPAGYYTQLRSTISTGTGNYNQKLKKLVKALNAQAPEVKYADLSLAFTNLVTPGSLTPFMSIAQGDTFGTRSGNSISLKHLTLRMLVSRNLSNPALADTYARVFIVKDKQGVSDTAPAVADIFSPIAPVTAMINLTNLSRFDIVWRSQVFDLSRLAGDTDGVTGTAIPTQSGSVEVDMPISGIVHYNGATAVDYQKNMYYLVILTDVSSGAGGEPVLDINGTSRTCFTDA